MEGKQFSLCWNNFHTNLSSGFHSLLKDEDLVDVTLAAEGKFIKAHKTVLSVCSPFFKELFRVNPCKHPIVILPEVNYEALTSLMHFMYQGEVSVSQEEIPTFMRVAEMLKVKGLTDNGASPSSDTNGFSNSSRSFPDQRQNIMKRPRPIKKLIRPIQHLRPVESPGLSPSPQPSNPHSSLTPQSSHPPQPSHPPQSSHTPQPVHTPQPSHTSQPTHQLQLPQQQSPTLSQGPPTKKLHLENDSVQFPTSTTPQPPCQVKTERIHDTLIKPKEEPLDHLDEDNTSHSGEESHMDISHMLDTSLGEPSPSNPFPIWPSMDFPPPIPQDSSSPDGFVFYKKSVYKGKAFWYCKNSRTPEKCQAVCWTMNGNIVKWPYMHSHPVIPDIFNPEEDTEVPIENLQEVLWQTSLN
ncbi:uncharacterized protein isoform X3 [Leptinotarsa decemlineata]|uniref:uncharacterized protein isoform X3 n=1 Tax=Leptinotarsa decemlineata TaxID=7539 RepID=UPI003D30C4D8